MTRKIGIFGGTFDPPHLGHIHIAKKILTKLSLDEIWFMPNHQPPHKEKSDGVTNMDRVNMLELSIEDHPQFRVETIELERPGPSYTFETIQILTERNKDMEFYFIIGADMIEYLPHWYKIDELVKLVTFVGVKRPNFSHETTYPVILVDLPEVAISSSDIRERLQTGESVQALLHNKVTLYIKEKKLYGS